MKKLVTAIGAITFIGTPVLAADLNKPAYKAPAPAGWYVGVNAGYHWAM